MKKNFFLTLMLAVLCTAASWAQFAPEAGKMYAFREVTSGLFLDIQTLGVTEPGQSTNNISLSAKPCVIYFGASNGKYTMKNVNGTYAQQASDRDWNAVIGTTAYEWEIADVDNDGYYTIARADGKFVKIDNATNGAPLYCDKDTGLEFALVEYTDLVDTHKYTTFKASKLAGDTRNDDTYLSMTAPDLTTTQVSFKAEPTKFHIIPSAGASILMQRGSEPAKYLAESTSNYWDAAISGTPYCWVISAEDTDGYVSITKLSNADHRVGHDDETTAGTGVFVNVSSDCNKWMLAETNIYSATVPTFTDEISTITSYGQYLTRLAIDGVGVYSGGAPSTIDDMYVETPVTGISLEPGVEYTMNLTFPTNQTSQILSAVIWFDMDGDGVFETHLGTTGAKAEKVGDTNDISTVTFTVPVDASQLLTRIRLRLDSSWGITNEPDAAANRMVYDIPVLITEAPTYTFRIENPSGQVANVTYNGNAIKDGDEVTGVINAGYVAASDIKGYTWRVVVDKNKKTITLVYVKKYSLHIVGAPNGVTLTYNGNEIGEGYYFDAEFDLTQFVVNNLPEGYRWEVSKDTEGKLVVVTFTALVTVENPAAVVALIKRIGGDGIEDKFKFVLEPSLNYNQEVFVIGGEDGKVLIKGTTISAITTGIGWYLNNYAHINIAWNSLNEKTVSGDKYADLSNIPVPTTTETRTSDAMYRYYLNTCTFGYSMTSWTWKRWQQEIDWMALHGINMPLQLVGMEEVWRKFLTMEEGGKRKYGYTDEAAKAFVAGPAFIAWWAMNNLEGWGGTAPGSKSGYNNLAGAGGVQDDAWYARQKALAKQITDRQRELGMQPVLPGWSGMVPTNFASKSGYATRGNGDNWAGDFVRPLLLSVGNTNYAEIAADYYKCLHEVMGESKYYSMDPFHEGGGAGTMEDYEALYAAMETAKPGSQWVIQQWQWSATQKYSLTAVPAGRLIVLDLFSDGSPAFDGYNGYAPQDAVFCAIPNFGGRSGLMGRLNNLTDNYFKFKGKYASIKGIGAAPEAIEQTPVTYDLIFQLPWMGTKPDVAEWVANYSIARYGVENADVQAAWELLRQGVLNYGADGIQGPVEDVWAARPNLTANAASAWGSTISKGHNIPAPGNTYTKERRQMLIDATYKLLSQENAISGDIYLSNYNYDLVELGGGVLADYAHDLLLGINAAKTAAGANFATDATYIARRDAFLQLILDVDRFKGTNLNFRLGKWTQEARDAAQEAIDLGATAANADWYEYNNARTILTTWSSPGTNLTDYSYRSWQGLLKDVYLPRWEAYFNANCADNLEYKYFEWNWAHGMTHAVGQTGISSTPLTAGQVGHTDSYTRDPKGNTVDVANEMLGKYIIPLKTDNGTTYAYRYLTNTLSAEYKVEGAEGGTIDMSKFFLANIDGATVTGDFINGTVNDIKAVPVTSDIAGNTYDAVMTLTDGTVVNFKVVVNSAAMVTAKEALAELIDLAEALIAEVATNINPTGKETTIGLQANYPNAAFYVSTNADQNTGGGNTDGAGIAGLVDNSNDTYFHSRWSGTDVNATHHIQVDLGEGNRLSEFKFSYVSANGPDPTKIVVKGSNNGEQFDQIGDIIIKNAINSGATYSSDIIEAEQSYRYLRFEVAESERSGSNATPQGEYCFSMKEFDIYDLTSTAEVAPKYANLAGVTAGDVEGVYDSMAEALYYYNNGGSAEQLQAAYEALEPLYTALNAKKDKVFNGVYKIMLKKDSDENEYDNSPISIAYNTTNENGWTPRVGYKMVVIDGDATTNAEADIYFTITPKDGGYSFQAQGMHLKQQQDDVAVEQWRHSLFSENEGDAGIYLFEETETGIFKIKGLAGNIPNLNAWSHGEELIIGNDQSSVYSTFSFVPVTKYTLNVPASGATTLCLPFNVVLPAGVTAYDLAKEANIKEGKNYSTYELEPVAGEGDVLAKNTPVIIKAAAKDYTLTITMNDKGAKGSVENSVLRSGIVKTALADGNNYTFDGVDFNLVAAGTVIPANQCYMALDENLGTKVYGTAPAFVLTTDEENPVLYKIVIKRAEDNSKVLSHDAENNKVKIVDSVDKEKSQAWYFMAGDNGGVLIKPYTADGNMLTIESTGDGADKAIIAAENVNWFQEWSITKSTQNGCTDYYYIKVNGTDGGTGTLSHNGGFNVTNYMGVWADGYNSDDDGSLFKFIDTEVEIPTLKYPELNKVYRIKSYVVNAGNHYHYLVNNNASIQFPLTVEDGGKSAMWVCTSANEEEHKYKFVSAIGTAALGWQGAAEEAVEYTISEGVENGTLALNYNGMYLALTTEEHNNGVKFNYATGNKHQRDVQHWSTDWMFEEVEDAEVAYERSFGEGLKWATLYLPYSVDVPDGVTAYYATSAGVDGNVINLIEVGKVPAYKAVLLYRGENATAGFSFAFEQNVDAAIVDGNIFEGRVMSGTVECVANHNYYLLLNAGNGEKFYWVLKEYDANGKYYPGQDKTHIKCEANKGYLKLPTQQGASSSYSFRIEGSTGIDEVKTENGEVKAIYDLQGRKLTEITKPGLYIVDGKKIFVK